MATEKPLKRIDQELVNVIDQIKKEANLSFTKASKELSREYMNLKCASKPQYGYGRAYNKKGQSPVDMVVIIVVLLLAGILSFIFANVSNDNNTAVQSSTYDATTKAYVSTTNTDYIQSFDFAILLTVGIVMAAGIFWASVVNTEPVMMFLTCGLMLVVAWVISPLDGLFTTQTANFTAVRAAIPGAAAVLDNIFYIVIGLEIIMIFVFFSRNSQSTPA